MIDILYAETNLGKTSLMTRWRPNSIVVGFDRSVTPQVRRVLGVIPRAVWSDPHRNGTPPADISHAALYKMANGLVADSNGNAMWRKYGIVRALEGIKKRYGTYDSVLRTVDRQRSASDIAADKARVKRLYGVDPETTGFWLVTKDNPTVFASDVGIDDMQILCRDARHAHFQAPKDLNDNTPIEFEGYGNILNQRMNIGKASHNFMEVMFRTFAQNFTDVAWTFTTHERRGGVAELESRNGGKNQRIEYAGGPEFLTNNQIDFITGYVDNSLRVVSEDRSVEMFEAAPWMFTPESLPGFASLMVHYRSGHPMHDTYTTKQRGPFWESSPGGPQGLYRGAGQPIIADMRGFEWLEGVMDAMLDVAPATGEWNVAEWRQLWNEMQNAGKLAFKSHRERTIRALKMNAADQEREFDGATTGCSFVGITPSDLRAQFTWALHEGWSAFVARKRQTDLLGAGDLLSL